MKTLELYKNPLLIAALSGLLGLAVACGDDDDSSNPAPSGGSKATGGSSNNNMAGDGTTPTSGSSTGGKTSTGGTTSSQAGMTDMPMAGAGGAEPASCTDDADMGCYKCAPKTREQFVNHCPTTGCEPFDNSKLTALKAGKLPALP